jgi:hypothetical protein
VVEHQHIGGEHAAARALVETRLPAVLHEIGLKAAQFRRAEAALGADLLPDFGVRLQVEIRQAAVAGFFRPLVDAQQLLFIGGGEEFARLGQGAGQAAGAKIILAALEHGEIEFDRHDAGQHRQVLFDELLLQIDGVGGNDRLLPGRRGEQDGRDQVSQAFADARASLDHQMFAALQSLGHGHGHLLLLRAVLEVPGFGENSTRRKNLRDLGLQVLAVGVRRAVRNAAHRAGLTIPARAAPPLPGQRDFSQSYCQGERRARKGRDRGPSRAR